MSVYDRSLNTRTTEDIFENLLAPAIAKAKTNRIEIRVPTITPTVDFTYINNIVESIAFLNQPKYTQGYTFFYIDAYEQFNEDTNILRNNALVKELTCVVIKRFETRSSDSIVEVYWRYKRIDEDFERTTPVRKIIY